jgi:predicted dehydrogenase
VTAPLRLAVVGAGIMGTNHARVARALPGIELVAVIDQDLSKATSAAGGAQAYTALEPVLDSIDAAVVAVPTRFHTDIAVQLAEAGKHVLIEKPIAPSVADAEAIIASAEAHDVVLAVGHVERFNAAVAELKHLVDEPLHIEASRIGSYSSRVLDGVILDLMIHDIDIVLSLLDEHVVATSISGVTRTVRSTSEDLAAVTVRFSNGMTAAFNTSRLGQQKIRMIEVTQPENSIIADLVHRDVTIHRMIRQEYLSTEGTRYRQSSVVELPFLETAGEPLALELSHFADCVASGTPPRVPGRAGLRALAFAHEILEATTND